DARDQAPLHQMHPGNHGRCDSSVDSYDRDPDAVHGYFASWRCPGELAGGGRVPPEQFLFRIVDDAWKFSLDVAFSDLFQEATCATARERDDPGGEDGNFVAAVLTINAVFPAETFVEGSGKGAHVRGSRAV